MKKLRSLIIILLVVMLLIGCGQEAVLSTNTTPLPTAPENTLPISTVPLETTVPPEALSSREQFADYYDLLNATPFEGFVLSDLLPTVFNSPEEFYPANLFYSSFHRDERDEDWIQFYQWRNFPESEINYLKENGMLTISNSIQKMPADRVDRVLQGLLGISLADLVHDPTDPQNYDSWLYYEETDCYYTNHGDALAIFTYSISKVEEIADDLLCIYYSCIGEDQLQYELVFDHTGYYRVTEMVLTLHLSEDGTWKAVSNQILSFY